MTIEETIKHCEEVAEEQDKLCKRYDDASGYSRSHNEDIRTTGAIGCEVCAKEHRQLAEWLKDYKRLLEQEPCEDCISRQAVIEKLHEYFDPLEDGEDVCPADVYHEIKVLPSVTSQSETVLYSGDGYADGYMVYDMAECPNCGYEYEEGDKDWKLPFCPNCGQSLNWESEG